MPDADPTPTPSDPHEEALSALDSLRGALTRMELPYLGKPSTLAAAHSAPLKRLRESVELHRDQANR